MNNINKIKQKPNKSEHTLTDRTSLTFSFCRKSEASWPCGSCGTCPKSPLTSASSWCWFTNSPPSPPHSLSGSLPTSRGPLLRRVPSTCIGEWYGILRSLFWALVLVWLRVYLFFFGVCAVVLFALFF